jgi:hypothetical protein
MNANQRASRSFRLNRFLALCLAVGGMQSPAAEDVEWREWKSAAGSTIEARLISGGPDEVVLEKRDGKRITVKVLQLSSDDRTFLSSGAGPTPKERRGETRIPGLDAEPGKVTEEIACQASPEWTYRLYLPNEFHSGRLWPVCFVMDPVGGSAKTLDRYLPAAEHLGIIMVVSRQSKNEFPESELAVAAMVKDVYARLPVLPNLAIASGMSGGSRMAYLLAESESNIAGVLTCGSGNGVYPKADTNSFRRANLRRGTVVCSLIGTNDYNRREAARTHKEYKKDSRLIWFGGNHDWAPSEVILEGMSHLYGEMLVRSKAPELVPFRADFARRQLMHAKAGEQQTPWMTFRWADYLAKFPGDTRNQSDARSLAGKLGLNPQVTRALKAEKEIEEFSDKYLSDGNFSVDKTPDEQRAKVARQRAETYQGLPQADLLKMLGGPAA